MSCGVGHSCGLDQVFLWLWCRPIWPLAWEPPCASGAALKRQKKKKKKSSGRGNSLRARQGKDLSLSLLLLGFDPWPGNLHMPQEQPKKKKSLWEGIVFRSTLNNSYFSTKKVAHIYFLVSYLTALAQCYCPSKSAGWPPLVPCAVRNICLSALMEKEIALWQADDPLATWRQLEHLLPSSAWKS